MAAWTILFDRRDGFMARLARRLHLNRASVGEWRDRGIPIAHCAVVEEECGGEFTRRDFRPDDWAVIWPELVSEADKIKEAG